MTPYTTRTGVQIGVAHQQRQHPSMDADAHRIQRALLGDKTTDWDGILIAVVCALAMALPWLLVAVVRP